MVVSRSFLADKWGNSISHTKNSGNNNRMGDMHKFILPPPSAGDMLAGESGLSALG